MSRKPIIAANWKMNIGPAEGAQFIESFKNLIKGKDAFLFSPSWPVNTVNCVQYPRCVTGMPA